MLFLYDTFFLVYDIAPVIFVLGTVFFIAMVYCFTNEEKIIAKREEKKRREEFKATMAEHPEWAAELNPDKIEEENALDQEQRDREEFERLAKEHPEWLK